MQLHQVSHKSFLMKISNSDSSVIIWLSCFSVSFYLVHFTFSLTFMTSTLLKMRESFPRQVDKESKGPQGERGLKFSRRKKEQTFFPSLHSLGLYNNNVSCLRTVSGLRIVSGLNLLANSVVLKCKLWEWT